MDNKYKNTLKTALIVGLASQVSIGFLTGDFKVSAGVISFGLMLFYYENMDPVGAGILSGISVYFFRLFSYFLINSSLEPVLISYLYEISFYISYGIIVKVFGLLAKRDNKYGLLYGLFVLIISDFISNLIEISFRMGLKGLSKTNTVLLVFLVSLVRSLTVFTIVQITRYYKMLLLKEEHENRYKRLLVLTSKLKTEMYWMEKNMENIELIMSESYLLFENINNNIDRDSWANSALEIAKNIHEVKKENGLAVRGIKEITETGLQDHGMDFKDMTSILIETMKREARLKGIDLEIRAHIGSDFHTDKHYYLMSIFTNLLMNSIDAMEDKDKKYSLKLRSKLESGNYIFIVKDNGGGIEEGLEDHIFSPGYSTKINYETGEINRGLGLSIVRNIVEEEFNGEIKFTSTIGEGTCFEVKIPEENLEVGEYENLYSGR